jgi:hypothetical protein
MISPTPGGIENVAGALSAAIWACVSWPADVVGAEDRFALVLQAVSEAANVMNRAPAVAVRDGAISVPSLVRPRFPTGGRRHRHRCWVIQWGG